jgi:hypothetical protein
LGIFRKAGIGITSENKRGIDGAIHHIVGVKYKDCPTVWREVKGRMAEDEAGFVAELKKALAQPAH